MNFKRLCALPQTSEEDIVQESWLKALEKTKNRPNAHTSEELMRNYQHIAGLVTHIAKHEKVNAYRQRQTESLTHDVPVWYNDDDPFEECTPEQIEAIKYYLSVTQSGERLTNAQRSKLKRLRKQTGLPLRVDEYYDKGQRSSKRRSTDATT